MTANFSSVAWRKSLRSNQTACVEFAVLPGVAAVRDSKRAEAGYLVVGRGEWAAFLAVAKAGGFDL